MNIDIKGMDKAKILLALYDNSHHLGLGVLQAVESFSLEDAVRALKQREEDGMYFDYLHGKVMKVRLDGDELNPAGYDMDNGQGAASRVISSLR